MRDLSRVHVGVWILGGPALGWIGERPYPSAADPDAAYALHVNAVLACRRVIVMLDLLMRLVAATVARFEVFLCPLP